MSRAAVLAAWTVAVLALAAPAAHAAGSRVTSLTVDGRQALSGGYERVHGVARGEVSGSEDVRGLPPGGLGYAVPYELIRPAAAAGVRLLLVEAENRGSPLLFNALTRATTSGPPATANYPASSANLLHAEHLAYGRIAWQTGIAPGVPATAQGVGEVIVRDFARFLARRYPHRALMGVSQGAFFVDTFLAEGFNAAPGGGRAYGQALTLDGTGNWMAINQLAGTGAQDPYVRPDGRPLSYARMLRRPKTDPTLVDVANYTDFYRLRAGLTDAAAPPSRVRRYDWASPHQSFPASVVFGGFGCNAGTAVPLNPLRYGPYLRGLVRGMARRSLPRSRRFLLRAPPPASPAFNGLPGVRVPVPRTDGNAQPRGGVRFPELDLPLGRLTPVSIPPVVTTSSVAVCGNSGGYEPFPAATVTRRHSRAAYLARYASAVTRLTRARYLRAGDRASLLAAAAADYDAATR